ncbi:MAG TPA: glycosyltransferase family 4 protein [Sphingobacteriaceae bacterium]|nr:glycosyltransferase family 4 protein [Sphingobacteriaceae bacterium]
MKVTLINRDDAGGGAAMACLRLFKALDSNQVDVSMLVQDKTSHEEKIKSTIQSTFDKIHSEYNFFYERLSFILKEQDKSVRFAFSTANAGTDIVDKPSVTNADILHLHWINGGFLSLNNLDKLLGLNKPVVWTLHDMWPFTGGCHYSGVSQKFIAQCGNCHFLKHPHPQDISYTGWHKKHDVYNRNKNITFVACSNWMREMAQKSSLLQGFEIITIPNAINIHTFSLQDKMASRRKWNIPENTKVILFGAANINHTRKGIKYLIEALNVLKNSSEIANKNIQLVIFGKSKGFDFTQIPFPVISLPIIKSETDLAEIYSLADVFVLPSLEDNLPNMVMEALSCSTPVVAFNSGGISDMVEHKQNGYLAQFMSVEDLARGIQFVIDYQGETLALNARKKIAENFSYDIIAEKHINLYKRLVKTNE